MTSTSRGEELDHHLSRQPHSRRIGAYLHPRLDAPGTGGDQRAGTGEFDHADPADIHGREVFQVAERGRVDSQGTACLQDRPVSRARLIRASTLSTALWCSVIPSVQQINVKACPVMNTFQEVVEEDRVRLSGV